MHANNFGFTHIFIGSDATLVQIWMKKFNETLLKVFITEHPLINIDVDSYIFIFVANLTFTVKNSGLGNMRRINKKHLKKFYEEEAKHLSHQEKMYLKGNKHQLWWHKKRLHYIFSFLSEIFRKNQIMTFADMGCAEGLYVKHIASTHNGTFCIGADIARTYIEKAKRNSKRLHTDYVVCDIENLPFKTDSIDVVLCSEVLEHVYNYHESLAELCRVGKKRLVISFPGHSYLYKIISKIKPVKRVFNNMVPNVGHVSEVKVSDVQTFLRGRGKCKSLETKIGGALPLKVYRIILWIRLVEVVDRMLCKALEHFGAVNYATIHVMKVMENKN